MPDKVIIVFKKNERDIRLMATYIAQLIKEDVTYTVRGDDISFEVVMLGGF